MKKTLLAILSSLPFVSFANRQMGNPIFKIHASNESDLQKGMQVLNTHLKSENRNFEFIFDVKERSVTVKDLDLQKKVRSTDELIQRVQKAVGPELVIERVSASKIVTGTQDDQLK